MLLEIDRLPLEIEVPNQGRGAAPVSHRREADVKTAKLVGSRMAEETKCKSAPNDPERKIYGYHAEPYHRAGPR